MSVVVAVAGSAVGLVRPKCSALVRIDCRDSQASTGTSGRRRSTTTGTSKRGPGAVRQIGGNAMLHVPTRRISPLVVGAVTYGAVVAYNIHRQRRNAAWWAHWETQRKQVAAAQHAHAER